MDQLIIGIAQYVIIVPVVAIGWLFVCLSRRERWSFIVRLVMAGVIAVVLSKILGALYFDPRPFTVSHSAPLFPHASDNGFPSDHTTFSMVIALVILPYRRSLGILLVLTSLMIGAARVASHVHSPLDIAGSIGVAVVSVILARYIKRNQ